MTWNLHASWRFVDDLEEVESTVALSCTCMLSIRRATQLVPSPTPSKETATT